MADKNNKILALANMTPEDQLDFLQSILASSTEYSIVATDLEGNILAWNAGAEKIYGYTADEILGQNAAVLFTPQDVNAGIFEKLLIEVKKQEFWSGEMLRIRKNGAPFTVLSTVTLRKDKQGNPVGLTAIARDLTELQNTLSVLNKVTTSRTSLLLQNRQLEELANEALEATRSKNEFIANVSHELRSPLNSIIGYAQILLDGLVDPQSPVHKEFLGNILSSSYQLLHLINDILDLAKIESGKMIFNYRQVDLHHLVEEIKMIFHTRLVKKNIHFEVEIDPGIKNIVTDPDKLKQVFYNYISNAIKFTEIEGKIRIQISVGQNNTFKIEVQDSGIGILEQDFSRLFVTFQQLDPSTAKKYPGTGLGLALTKRIVQAQGGQVGVKSTAGHGSTFYAILPMQPQIEPSTASVNEQNNSDIPVSKY